MDKFHWYVDCFIPEDKEFAVQCYMCRDLGQVIETARNTLGRSSSGICEINVVLMAVDGIYHKLIREKRFTTMQDAMNTLKLWAVFS
jgi:hypothetical protein